MKLPKEWETRIRAALAPLCPEKVIHTKPMHQAFVRRDSMFACEIMTRGEVRYERVPAEEQLVPAPTVKRPTCSTCL